MNENANPAEQRAEQIENSVPTVEGMVDGGTAPAQTPPPAQTPAPAQTPPQPSKRDTFRQRFAEANQDLDMNDEDAYYDRASQYMDEHKAYGDALKNVKAAVGSSEDFQNLIASLAEHNEEDPEHPWTLDHYLIEKVQNGEIDLDELANNPDYAKIITQSKAKKTADKEEKERLEAEGEQNYIETQEMFKRIRDERGLSNEQVNQAIDFAYTLADDLRINKMTEENFTKLLDMMNYDEAVSTARQEGEAAGINRNLKEKFRQMPSVPERAGGYQTPIPEQQPETEGTSMFGI